MPYYPKDILVNIDERPCFVCIRSKGQLVTKSLPKLHQDTESTAYHQFVQVGADATYDFGNICGLIN